MLNKIVAGSLFAGIGGFCLGFERVGIKTAWAVENDPWAIKTYLNNRKIPNFIDRDVKGVHVESQNLEPVDVLHAGFPCQSFSQAGERKGFNDPRGQLFYEVIRIINEFKDRKPSVLVLENAPHLRHGDGGSWFIELSKEIRNAGYWFRDSSCAELDTFELTTLPQKRNRLFMVAFSINKFNNGKFCFPSSNNILVKDLSQFVNFQSSIDDDSYYLSNENRYFKMINKKIEDRNCIYQLRKYLVRVKEPNVCPTLTANMGLGGHNVPFILDSKGIRKLTEYECLRLQGFPEEFSFPDDVPRARRYVQVGNSVAVPVVQLVAALVKDKIVKECLK